MWFLPELRYFPDARTRRKALSQATAEVHGIAWVLGFAVLSSLVAYFSLLPLLQRIGSFSFLDVVVLAAFVFVCTLTLFFLTFRATIRRSLRRQLLAFGFKVCLSCGYDLSMLPHDRCPECGSTAAADPGMSGPERFFLWVLLVVATAMLLIGLPWAAVSGRLSVSHLPAIFFWLYVASACFRRLFNPIDCAQPESLDNDEIW